MEHLDVVQVDAVVKGLLIRAITEAWVRPIQLAKTVSRLITFDPKIRPLIERVVSTRRMDLPSQGALTLSDLGTVADNALLTSLLQVAPVSDISLERCMTAARRAMLDAAASVAVGSDGPDEPLLSLYCSLARQCFINEYIFSCTEPECQAVEELRERTVAALRRGDVVPALWVITIGAYMSLSSLPCSDALLEQSRAAPVAALVIQQVTEPALERRLRDTISRLTPIDDQVSQVVQRQYEENPYPRWVKVAANRTTTSIGEYVQRELHFSGPQHLRTASAANILVAGCGTGQESIEMARRFPRSRILALDLSLSSLCYAKRKTTELGLTNVEYAQGDIVALGCVDLIFDVIYSVGVLHHLAEPIAGWKQLCSILRDGGLMCLGLYSERARKTVSSGRTFVEDRGYTATPADIRRCREEIIFRGAELGLTGLTGFADFFVMSECRDLLFHVKEHRYTIPQLKEMLKELGLDFLGFSVEPGTLRMYRERFPRDESSADLDNWDVFEAEHPETFVGMYQFWVYKPANASA